MKLSWVILASVISFSGCAVLDQATRDAITCQKDPVCYQTAKDRSNLVSGIASTFNPIVGTASGAFVLAIGLWLGGKRKRMQSGGLVV